MVPEETAFGFVTVFGLAMLVGRLFDTAADPVVGFLSDRSRSRLGRRRSMLVYGIGPMVVIPALLFFPPFEAGSTGNGVWLATVVLGRSEGFTLWLTAALGVGLGAGFLVQRPLVDRYGPKRVMMGCVAWMALGVGCLGMLAPDAPGGPRDLRNLVVCLGALGLFGVPAAGLLVLPHVIISQLIDADARRTGATRAAMFFGVQGLLTKWVYGLGTWLFSFLLLRYGKSPESALGVVLVGPVAAGFALAAFVLYAFYPEERVLREGNGGGL